MSEERQVTDIEAMCGKPQDELSLLEYIRVAMAASRLVQEAIDATGFEPVE